MEGTHVGNAPPAHEWTDRLYIPYFLQLATADQPGGHAGDFNVRYFCFCFFRVAVLWSI